MSILTELGLTILQAKVYLTLAKSRTLKASEISLFSGVARPDVYRVLTLLEQAGLVEVMISKPEEFHAISIDKCLCKLVQIRKSKMEELQQKVVRLSHDFERNGERKEPEEKFQFILISNRDAVYERVEKMIKCAKERICFLAIRRRMINWLSNYSHVLEEALTRKVYCQIIMPNPERSITLQKYFETFRKYPSFSLRLISETPGVGFSVWDRKEILLSTSAIDSPLPFPILFSNNNALVRMTQDYFDLIWQKGKRPNFNREKSIISEKENWTEVASEI